MSNQSESEKREGREFFDRRACLLDSIKHFRLNFFQAMAWGGRRGAGFETQVLGGEVSEGKDGRLVFSPAVGDEITKWGRELASLVEKNPDIRLADYQGELEQQIREIGPTILRMAEENGLVVKNNKDTLFGRLEASSRHELEYELENDGSLCLKGWGIFEDKKGGFVLVVPSGGAGVDSNEFDTVDLSALNGIDPEFLQERIKDYYRTAGKRDLVSLLTYNLAMHQIDPATLTPPFLGELGKVSMEEGRRQIEGMAAFLHLLGEKSTRENICWSVARSLQMSSVPLPDGRSACLDLYLRHLAGCPGSPEKVRGRMGGPLQGLAILSNGETIVRMAAPLVPTPEDAEVLGCPTRYLVAGLIQRAEKQTGEKKRAAESLALLLTRQTADKDPRAFLDLLKNEFPELDGLLENFRTWLGTDYEGNEEFDGLINAVSSSRDLGLSGELDPDKVKGLLERELAHRAYQKEPFPGVGAPSRPSYRQEPMAPIYDFKLQILLSLLVIKTAQSEFRLGERKLEKLDSVVKALVGLTQAEADRAGDALATMASDRKKGADFLKRAKITSGKVEALVRLTKGTDDEGGFYMDRTFEVGLIALYLSAKDKVDLRWPSFRALVKELYLDFHDSIWDGVA